MSNNTSSKGERQDKLTSMWELTANAVLRALAAEAPSAAVLDAARKFLIDNDCTLATLRDWSRTPLGFDPSHLPTFNDDDDDQGGAPAMADALRIVPDFDNP